MTASYLVLNFYPIIIVNFCEDVQAPEYSEDEAEIQDLFHEREEKETKPWKKGQSLSH